MNSFAGGIIVQIKVNPWRIVNSYGERT